MVKTVIGVEDMMCGNCEAHVSEAIRNHFDVKKVSASRKDKNAVILSEEAPDEGALRALIEETGYTMTTYTSEPYEKKGFRLFS